MYLKEQYSIWVWRIISISSTFEKKNVFVERLSMTNTSKILLKKIEEDVLIQLPQRATAKINIINIIIIIIIIISNCILMDFKYFTVHIFDKIVRSSSYGVLGLSVTGTLLYLAISSAIITSLSLITIFTTFIILIAHQKPSGKSNFIGSHLALATHLAFNISIPAAKRTCYLSHILYRLPNPLMLNPYAAGGYNLANKKECKKHEK